PPPRRNIYWTVTARAARPLPGSCGQPWRSALYNARTDALNRLDRLYAGRPYSTAMMKATLIGDTATLDQLWTENFRRTGTYHALVISGLHVTVLAGVLLFFLRVAGTPPLLALALTSVLAWLYALLAGLQAPVLRAAAGFTLFALARFFYRRGRILNLLAAVAIGVLAVDPEQLFEASFQLSFASVALLGAFAVPLIEATTHPFALGLRGLTDLARDPHLPPRVAQFRVELRLAAEALRVPVLAAAAPVRLLIWIWEMFVVSAISQAGILLLMITYFHRLSWTGLSANLFVIPAMSLAVPAGFLAILANSTLAARLAEAMLFFSRWVTDLHARWEYQTRIPDPPSWLAAAALAALAAMYLAARHRPRWIPAAALPLAGLLGVIVAHPFAPRVLPGALELTAIDVGQGESLLVAFPDGRLMLVDGGGLPVFGDKRPRPRLDIGEDVVSPYLWTRSIRRLDIVAASHSHEDHVGGLPAVIANFRPREIWLTSKAPSPLRSLGVPVRELQAGFHADIAGVVLETLSPSQEYEPGAEPHNEDSLVFRLTYGRHRFLLTGDREGPIEAGPVDVLKVAHHGGRRGTSPEFLDAARPSFALISAGLDNMYRHPHPAVLDRLAVHHTSVYRTDRDGLITIRSDGRRLSLSGTQ
ncbi:MAG TPA: hypothetical protein DEH78_00525, partial [Solibacterales bacterium]|nr:hypothetical protein [Bryobacterales bacterium]